MSEHRGALTAEGELYPSPRRALDYLDVDPPEPGHALEIGAGLRWARIPLPMELNHINVWLLRLADGWMLVDTGLSHDVCREAWHTLEAGHLDGLGLQRIFVTHDHPDHMGLSGWLHERHGAPVWMSEVGHRSTRDFLAASPTALRDLQHAFVTAHGMHVEREALERAAGSEHGKWFGILPPLNQAPAGGDRLQAAGREWELIETSGHCRGHLCLYDAQHQVLIAGDQVLPTISPNVSVLPSRPEANPLRDFLDSLARLEACAPNTKPAAAAAPKTSDSSRPCCRSRLSRATPSTAQLVVIKGRNTPSNSCSSGLVARTISSVPCTMPAINRMKTSVRR